MNWTCFGGEFFPLLPKLCRLLPVPLWEWASKQLNKINVVKPLNYDFYKIVHRCFSPAFRFLAKPEMAFFRFEMDFLGGFQNQVELKFIYSEKATKILRNLPLTFDYSTYGQKLGEDFAKFCGLLRIYELYYSFK